MHLESSERLLTIIIRVMGEIMLQRVRQYFERANTFAEYPQSVLGVPRWFLHIDYALACLIYGCSISEYYLYQFYKLSIFERQEFLTLRKWTKLLRADPESLMDSIENKKNFLSRFNEFLCRDWVSPKLCATMETCVESCNKHRECILKPINECGGNGIEILELKPNCT